MLSDLMQSDGGADEGAGKLLRATAVYHADGHGRGRITANSFRLLTAKLKRKEEPAPEPLALVVAETAIPELETAVFAENLPNLEPVQMPDPGAELVDELPLELVTQTAVPDFGLPVFQPLELFQPAIHAQTEPVVEMEEVPAAIAAGDFPEVEAVLAEPDVESVVEAAPEEPVMLLEDVPAEALPEPVATTDIAPQVEDFAPEAIEAQETPTPEVVEVPEAVVVNLVQQAEIKEAPVKSARVVDAMLKTIADAIYAKPSAAERAVFLHDVAELGETQPVETEAAAVTAPAPVQLPVMAAKTEPAELAEEALEPLPLSTAIAARIGPSSSLLRNSSGEPDVFAKNLASLALTDPKPQETAGADEETGDLALTLLDMMSAGAGTALPQERALAADTLLRILTRIPVKQLLNVVERVAIMHAPPPLLVAKLIRDPRPEVVAPLLERCMHITDQDLMAAATEGDMAKQRMIARRRALSTVLADHLIALGDPSVMLTLIRNPGASFSHDAFYKLAGMASEHHGLLAPLATRADLPPPVAFELFWYVPQELRRFIFSRFLTDSETLNKILRITLATHGGGDGDVLVNEVKFPDRDLIDRALAAAADFKLDEAAQSFAEMASISRDTVLRIIADRQGEPLTVLLKAMGYARGKFSEAIEKLQVSESGVIAPGRVVEELQSIFDGLSFNKARILLTYWDWFVRKAGPYAPRN